MGTLYIVSTPIGNREDITIRATRILQSVDVILCEDTRRTGLLIETTAKFVSYYDHIEHTRTPEVIVLLESGKNIALVSDAGTPLISDPGYVLVREARKRGIPVVSIPGPSALLTALTSSGLPTDKFMFLGYPPEKKSHRTQLFTNLLSIKHLIGLTYVLYCAPHKLISTLEDMKTVFGDIDITIARELTKIHEEVWSGLLDAAIQKFHQPKGEVVLLFNIPQGWTYPLWEGQAPWP